MAKKQGKRKSATKAANGGKEKRLFSLVALHREFKKAQQRLAKQPKTPAANKLLQDLQNARAMVDCGQTMSPDIG